MRHIFYLQLLLLLCYSKMNAQVCKGTLGPIRFNISFGQDLPNFGPPITGTTYTYVAGNPADGQYTITHTTAGLNSGWHQNIVNQNPDNTIGYIMVVNASYTQDVFYETTVNGLCPNTTYEFSAYIINILKNAGIKPNVKFTIEQNSVVLKEYVTGDIPEGGPTDWKKYGATFTTSNDVSNILLKMTNQNPGGVGNDLALDEIAFRPCGPEISTLINDSGSQSGLCVGESGIFNLAALVSAGYNNPQYQWQQLEGGNWVDLPGETATQTKVIMTNAVLGTYKYRLIAAEFPNIQTSTCRVSSPELTINVTNKFNPVASYSGNSCVGGSIKLDVDQGFSFKWTGPNGYSSTLKSPTIASLVPENAGTYTIAVSNAGGCISTGQIEVQVLPPVQGNTNITEATICEGAQIELEASGGSAFSWSPATGLSAVNTSNPIAKPTTTTTYTVTISNGSCSIDKTITVKVNKLPNADAGADGKILAGETIKLNGAAKGDAVSYYWTPTDYLDDPTKLEPTARPPKDMTYTLNVTSPCGISTDDVAIKVYPEVVIPNSFSPNGDGINDTWKIPAIASFPKVKIRVVNRYGLVVFESGKTTTWNGKWNDNDAPIGTYYYTVYINENYKLYAGWVFLIR
jgi:gliding motility-associated-like protein